MLHNGEFDCAVKVIIKLFVKCSNPTTIIQEFETAYDFKGEVTNGTAVILKNNVPRYLVIDRAEKEKVASNERINDFTALSGYKTDLRKG